MEFSTRISPTDEAEQDSPETDFRSSMSTPLGGDELVEEEEVMKARDRREVERSKGESETEDTFSYWKFGLLKC